MTRPVNNGVDLSIRQFCEAWRVLCGGSAGQRQATGEGIEYIFSGLPVAFFNVAILTGQSLSAETLQARGQDARAWAADQSVPWLFIVTQEELEPGVDATAVLDECGLAPIMPLTGMFAQQVSPGTSVPDDLLMAVPHDDAGCSALLDVNSAAYEMDLGAARPAIGTRTFWRDHVPVLGTVDGVPASAAAVLMVDGYRYVALVATSPAHQRRGYADAAMRRALAIAAETHGELPSLLHATDAGRPIYQRMGYTPIATHTIFMDKAFLGEH